MVDLYRGYDEGLLTEEPTRFSDYVASASSDPLMDSLLGLGPYENSGVILPIARTPQGEAVPSFPAPVQAAARTVARAMGGLPLDIDPETGLPTEEVLMDAFDLSGAVTGLGLLAPRPAGSLGMGGRGMIGHNRPPATVGRTPYIVENELRGTEFRTAVLPDGSRTLIDAAGNPYIEEKTLNKLLTGVPHYEMTSEFTPPPAGVLLPEVEVMPEQFEGGWVVNLSGDRTRYGNLSKVNDVELYGGGVDLEGGDDFMRSLRAVWASASGAVSSIENQVKAIRSGLLGGDPNAPIYGTTTNMAERSGDFAVDTAETVMRMIPNSPIKKDDFLAFEKKIKEKYPDYPGMKDPDKALEWLKKDAQTTGAGNRRLFFVQEVAKGSNQSKGFPDIGSVRAAISKPETRFMPYGRTGAAIGLLAPEGQLATRMRLGDIENPHKTYPDMIGDALGYEGGYPVTIGRSLGFPDTYARMIETEGKKPAGIRRAFDIGREVQFMRPDVVDPQMKFIEDQRRMLREEGLLF